MPPVITNVEPAPNPTIKIIFQGLVIAHLNENFAQIAAIESTPCHRPKISIAKFKDGVYQDEFNVGRRLKVTANKFPKSISLEVVGAQQAGISAFQAAGDFDRKKPTSNHLQDFRWFIDVERDIFKVDTPLEVNEDKIGPIFRLQNAHFYSAGPSENGCLIKREETQEQFGHVTEALCADITLDQLHSTAVLKIGDREVLSVNASDLVNHITYEVLFDCDCHGEGDAEEESEPDFKHVIAAMLPPPTVSKNIEFLKTDELTSTNHEVPCGGAHTGSPLPGG